MRNFNVIKVSDFKQIFFFQQFKFKVGYSPPYLKSPAIGRRGADGGAPCGARGGCTVFLRLLPRTYVRCTNCPKPAAISPEFLCNITLKKVLTAVRGCSIIKTVKGSAKVAPLTKKGVHENDKYYHRTQRNGSSLLP